MHLVVTRSCGQSQPCSWSYGFHLNDNLLSCTLHQMGVRTRSQALLRQPKLPVTLLSGFLGAGTVVYPYVDRQPCLLNAIFEDLTLPSLTQHSSRFFSILAGKTTLLQHILQNKENLKCAVIVNDMAVSLPHCFRWFGQDVLESSSASLRLEVMIMRQPLQEINIDASLIKGVNLIQVPSTLTHLCRCNMFIILETSTHSLHPGVHPESLIDGFAGRGKAG